MSTSLTIRTYLINPERTPWNSNQETNTRPSGTNYIIEKSECIPLEGKYITGKYVVVFDPNSGEVIRQSYYIRGTIVEAEGLTDRARDEMVSIPGKPVWGTLSIPLSTPKHLLVLKDKLTELQEAKSPEVNITVTNLIDIRQPSNFIIFEGDLTVTGAISPFVETKIIESNKPQIVIPNMDFSSILSKL